MKFSLKDRWMETCCIKLYQWHIVILDMWWHIFCIFTSYFAALVPSLESGSTIKWQNSHKIFLKSQLRWQGRLLVTGPFKELQATLLPHLLSMKLLKAWSFRQNLSYGGGGWVMMLWYTSSTYRLLSIRLCFQRPCHYAWNIYFYLKYLAKLRMKESPCQLLYANVIACRCFFLCLSGKNLVFYWYLSGKTGGGQLSPTNFRLNKEW